MSNGNILHPDRAVARNTDPETSHKAAGKVDVPLHREIVLREAIAYLESHADFIAEELEAICAPHAVSPASTRSRLSELRKLLWFDLAPYKRKNSKGNNCRAYVLHEVGKLRLEKAGQGVPSTGRGADVLHTD